MKLKDWRENKQISQAALANELLHFTGRYVSQRTVCSWENGSVPRKFWMRAIKEFTNKKVGADDLAE